MTEQSAFLQLLYKPIHEYFSAYENDYVKVTLLRVLKSPFADDSILNWPTDGELFLCDVVKLTGWRVKLRRIAD